MLCIGGVLLPAGSPAGSRQPGRLHRPFSISTPLGYTSRDCPRRAKSWPRLAPIIEAGSGDVGMTEPFLHFGDIGLMREGIRGGGGAQRMDAQPVYFGADASFQSILPHDILIHRGGSRDDQGPRYGGEEPRD